MCIKCHSGIPDEEVERQLSEQNDFAVWNTTSLSHVTIAAMGANGPRASQLAEDLLKQFREWKLSNPSKNDGCFFGPPSIEQVDSALEGLKNLKESLKSAGISDPEAIRHLFNFKDYQM